MHTTRKQSSVQDFTSWSERTLVGHISNSVKHVIKPGKDTHEYTFSRFFLSDITDLLKPIFLKYTAHYHLNFTKKSGSKKEEIMYEKKTYYEESCRFYRFCSLFYANFAGIIILYIVKGKLLLRSFLFNAFSD